MSNERRFKLNMSFEAALRRLTRTYLDQPEEELSEYVERRQGEIAENIRKTKNRNRRSVRSAYE